MYKLARRRTRDKIGATTNESALQRDSSGVSQQDVMRDVLALESYNYDRSIELALVLSKSKVKQNEKKNENQEHSNRPNITDECLMSNFLSLPNLLLCD